MARTAQIVGLLICVQAAAGLATALEADWARSMGRLSVLDRLPWLADYAVFANASLLIVGIAVIVAAARLRGR